MGSKAVKQRIPAMGRIKKMRCINMGKNVNVPLTKRVYEAHLKDIQEWLAKADAEDRKQLTEREKRVNKYWTAYLNGDSDTVLNEKK